MDKIAAMVLSATTTNKMGVATTRLDPFAATEEEFIEAVLANNRAV